MKITIDEKKFNDLCDKARAVFINDLKHIAEKSGEKMSAIVELGESVSIAIFCVELKRIMFENVKDEKTPDKNDDSMAIRLNIPKEFINHYKSDMFMESLNRIRFDLSRLVKKICEPCIVGNYELELLDMFIDAFSCSEIMR